MNLEGGLATHVRLHLATKITTFWDMMPCTLGHIYTNILGVGNIYQTIDDTSQETTP
jgi:hypothetical protein